MLVAGGAGPLGRSVALALAEAGAGVALAAPAGDQAGIFAMNSIANELWALERRHVTLTLEPQAAQSAETAVQQTIGEFGRLDLLVTLPPALPVTLPLTEIGPTELSGLLESRLGLVLQLTRAAGAALLETGGSVLNSVRAAASGHSPLPAAMEAGVLALTRPLARDWSGRIAVNAAVIRLETDPEALASLTVHLAASQSKITGQIFEL